MTWKGRRFLLLQQLPPDVAEFVSRALATLEEQNIFDAPSVIAGVLTQMRAAESQRVREALAHTERLLTFAFTRDLSRFPASRPPVMGTRPNTYSQIPS